MQNESDCYVLATIEGPFGEMQQVSGLMRPSEAAMTIVSIMPDGKPPKPSKGQQAWLKDARIVRIQRGV